MLIVLPGLQCVWSWNRRSSGRIHADQPTMAGCSGKAVLCLVTLKASLLTALIGHQLRLRYQWRNVGVQ